MHMHMSSQGQAGEASSVIISCHHHVLSLSSPRCLCHHKLEKDSFMCKFWSVTIAETLLIIGGVVLYFTVFKKEDAQSGSATATSSSVLTMPSRAHEFFLA